LVSALYILHISTDMVTSFLGYSLTTCKVVLRLNIVLPDWGSPSIPHKANNVKFLFPLLVGSKSMYCSRIGGNVLICYFLRNIAKAYNHGGLLSVLYILF
jgi:hypothetical protein